MLVGAGLLKSLHPEAIIVNIAYYHLTPDWLSIAVGILLPAVEVVAGVALMMGMLVRGAALISAALSVMFFGVVSSAMARNLDVECSCFGDLLVTPRAGPATLTIDLMLLAISLYVLFAQPGKDLTDA